MNKFQFYSDVIVTAVEGGSNYWAEFKDYAWQGREDDVTVTVRDPDWEGDGEEATPWKVITNGAIAHAYSQVNRGTATEAAANCGIHETYVKHLRDAYRDEDAADLDAGDADVLLQLAVLGKVIYG